MFLDDSKNDPKRKVLDFGGSGVLILPVTYERVELGCWRLIQKELIEGTYLSHAEWKVGVEGSWTTDRIIQWYMHRPWYMIDNRLRLELHNACNRWDIEVEPWSSVCFPLEPEYISKHVYPTATGSALHKFYVHAIKKIKKVDTR